jgi:hypothetical protein
MLIKCNENGYSNLIMDIENSGEQWLDISIHVYVHSTVYFIRMISFALNTVGEKLE